MRLTLRTLLAWLDDTLPPNEVRHIGKQVAESPFAQELVDRTYRVTRQRRLLVPSGSGPEATDPNLVSAYLDNELSPDEVAEYEKKCLTSDVNLAEVASVHQILSLIGQKAKVPTDAKKRMYRLVKGRESAYAQDAVRRPPPPPVVEPVTQPPTPWASPTAAKRPTAERVGIAALVVGLLALIGWTAYTTFAPESDRASIRLAQAEPAPPVVPPAEPVKEPAPTAEPPKAEEAKPAPPPDIAKAEEAKPGGPPTAKLATPETLLLEWNPARSDWARAAAASPIKPDTRLLNVAPFWSGLQADSAKVRLVDETAVTYKGHDGKASIKLDFDRGKLLLSGGSDGEPYLVTHEGQTCAIASSPGTSVGLQRTWTHTPGVATAESAPILIYVTEGEASFTIGDAKKTLKGPAVATWTGAGEIQTSSKSAMPPWMAESAPPSVKEMGDRFLKDFSPNGSVLRDLVQAVDGEDPDVRRLAIQALGAIGEADMVVPVLNSTIPPDPASRRVAADVLRSMIARGGEPAKAVREELAKTYGAELASAAEKLLVGFTAEEGSRESTYADLVRLLSTPELGTRELALQALMSLTGRDNLEFDPTKPESGGLKAWQDLVSRKEIMKGRTPPGPR